MTTTIKADLTAADRALNRACAKSIALLRAGQVADDVRPVLAAAVVTAAVLLEER